MLSSLLLFCDTLSLPVPSRGSFKAKIRNPLVRLMLALVGHGILPRHRPSYFNLWVLSLKNQSNYFFPFEVVGLGYKNIAVVLSTYFPVHTLMWLPPESPPLAIVMLTPLCGLRWKQSSSPEGIKKFFCYRGSCLFRKPGCFCGLVISHHYVLNNWVSRERTWLLDEL